MDNGVSELYQRKTPAFRGKRRDSQSKKGMCHETPPKFCPRLPFPGVVNAYICRTIRPQTKELTCAHWWRTLPVAPSAVWLPFITWIKSFQFILSPSFVTKTYTKPDGWQWLEVYSGGGWSTVWLAGQVAKQEWLEKGGATQGKQSREDKKQKVPLLL